MDGPPAGYNICGRCGVEFGVDDQLAGGIGPLRDVYIAAGRPAWRREGHPDWMVWWPRHSRDDRRRRDVLWADCCFFFRVRLQGWRIARLWEGW